MSDPYFQQLFAERIGGAAYGKGTDIYKFEKIKRAKRKALQEHPERELLDFGIGENDSMADAAVREVMAREINRTENRGYADNGIAEFKEAAVGFMSRSLGVSLDPESQINHSIGSKPALAMLPAAFINPGDVKITCFELSEQSHWKNSHPRILQTGGSLLPAAQNRGHSRCGAYHAEF